MRTFRELDDEIARAERRIEAHRDRLNDSLSLSRVRTRSSLGSPKALAAAFAAGFLLERLGRLRPRGTPRAQAGGMAGIAAGLAAAALRAALANPGLWESLRGAWQRRTQARRQQPNSMPRGAAVWRPDLERAVREEMGERTGGMAGAGAHVPPATRPAAHAATGATAAHR